MHKNNGPQLIYISEINLKDFSVGRSFNSLEEARDEVDKVMCHWPIIIVAISSLNELLFMLARPEATS
tara:strand:- start:3692 stop:3895 length:204 start_codon:yes stop_codon:yes gene_type:complete